MASYFYDFTTTFIGHGTYVAAGLVQRDVCRIVIRSCTTYTLATTASITRSKSIWFVFCAGGQVTGGRQGRKRKYAQRRGEGAYGTPCYELNWSKNTTHEPVWLMQVVGKHEVASSCAAALSSLSSGIFAHPLPGRPLGGHVIPQHSARKQNVVEGNLDLAGMKALKDDYLKFLQYLNQNINVIILHHNMPYAHIDIDR